MKKKFALATTFFLLLSQSVYAIGNNVVYHPNNSSVQSTIPGVTKEMFDPDFWCSKLDDGNRIIMDQTAIEEYNEQLRAQLPNILFNLAEQPTSWSKEDLSAMLEPSFPDYPVYVDGKEVSPSYFEQLKEQINIEGLKDQNSVNYGFTVRRTNMRTYPTHDFLVDSPDDVLYDNIQETSINPAQPLIVLHTSKNGRWYYVRIHNYTGWVSASDVAVTTDRSEWLSYMNSKNFLVVTGSKLRLGYNPYSPELSELMFEMGARLPLVTTNVPTIVDNQNAAGCYVIKLPVRDSSGKLKFKNALVPLSADVSEGYLPYTRENIIKQAFKLQGERYGWGGLFNGMDCSAMIMNVYSTFGIKLPRNTSQQVKIEGNKVDFSGAETIDDREKLLSTLKPGAAVYKPGHAVIYLGEHNGKYYAIHDAAEYGDINHPNPDGTLNAIPLHTVSVIPVDWNLLSGKTFIETATFANQYEPSSKY